MEPRRPAGPFPFLARAPIVEALIDFRVEARPGTRVEGLASLGKRLASRFPNRVERIEKTVRVDLALERAATLQEEERGVQGYAFHSADGRQVVQVQGDGLTLNRLKPYPGWERVREDWRHVWDEYRQLAAPLRVVRIAIRTINRIELPFPVGDLKQYLRTLPEIAEGVPQGMLEFFLRVVVPEPNLRATAIFTEGLERLPPDAASAPVILDVDVFREDPLPPDSQEIWESLERLRELKNRIFFSSITDRTVALLR